MESQEKNSLTLVTLKRELTDEIKELSIYDLVKYGLDEDVIREVGTKTGISTVGELLKFDTDKLYECLKNGIYYNHYWYVRRSIMGMGLLFDDDRKQMQDAGISDEIALIPIEKLDLTPRLKNTLTKRAGMKFLGELLTTDYSSLAKTRTLGEDGLVELKNYIHSLGFSLQNEEVSMKEIKESYKEKGIPMVQEELNLDGRTAGVLYRNGIYTVQDLVNFGSKVFELVGMGDVKKVALEQAMANKGIQLGTPVVLPTETSIAIRPTGIIVTRAKQDNDVIKSRIENKEKLLAEYDELMKERSELLSREQKLDEEIAAKIAMLQTAQQKEEGTGYGRR